MLLHQPPFLIVERLTLFPDHLDPYTYYYLVSLPELAKVGSEPAFWATAVLSDVRFTAAEAPVDDVARLSVAFDACLPAASPAELERASKVLSQRLGREQVRLQPVPMASGKALLAVARAALEGSEEQLFIHSGHPPALVGDHRAALALAATGLQAQTLAALLQSGGGAAGMGAIVAYELDFVGLAPAFNASMKVSWSLIYQHLTERQLNNYVFYSDELDRTLDELRESSAITIQVDELDPEASSEATRALWNELKSEVLEKLFEPAFPAGEVPLEERIGRGLREVVSSVLPGQHHALRRLEQHALKDTTIDLRARGARVYHYNPQSTLAGMLARAGVQQRLVLARLGDLPDRAEELRVEVAPDLARLGIRRVVLEVKVESEDGTPLAEASYPLDGSEPAAKLLRYRRRGTAEALASYSADVYFEPLRAPEGRERWSLPAAKVKGGRVYFSPEEHFDVTHVRVSIDDVSMFSLPAQAEMQLEARLPGSERLLHSAHLSFSAEQSTQEFSVVAPQGLSPIISGVEVLRRPGEPEVRVVVPQLSGPLHVIRNPFSFAWRMDVRSVVDWSKTELLAAEFRVWEPQRQAWLRSEHRFLPQAPVTTLAFATAPSTPLEAQVRLTRVDKRNGVVRGPWRDLAGRIVSVSDDVQPLRRVRVTLYAPGFQQARVRRVSVELNYPHTPELPPQRLDFTRDGQSQDWIFPFLDVTRPGYRWRARAISEDNERWVGPPCEGADDDLQLVLPAQPFTG